MEDINETRINPYEVRIKSRNIKLIDEVHGYNEILRNKNILVS